ncbi:MAG: hypothetical protein MI866_17110, partial [Bacteroidales bacterium]|nr:hypothetical protein [Bacteroidales bacterium]
MRTLIIILIIGLANRLPILGQNDSNNVKARCVETSIENAVFEIDVFCKRFDKVILPELEYFEKLKVVTNDSWDEFPRTYKFRCNKAGLYTIEPIKVVLNHSRDTIELQPLTINILPKQTDSNHKINPDTQLAYVEKAEEIELEDFFMKLDIDKNKITTKDSILVRFLLYNSLENYLKVENFSIMPPDMIQISKADEKRSKNIVRYERRNYEVTLLNSCYLKFRETGIYDARNFVITGKIFLTQEDPLDLFSSENKKSEAVTIPIKCEKIKVNK